MTWDGGLLLRLIRAHAHPRLGIPYTILLTACRFLIRRCEVCGGTGKLTTAWINGHVVIRRVDAPNRITIRYGGWVCFECVRESGMDGSGT